MLNYATIHTELSSANYYASLLLRKTSLSASHNSRNICLWTIRLQDANVLALVKWSTYYVY